MARAGPGASRAPELVSPGYKQPCPLTLVCAQSLPFSVHTIQKDQESLIQVQPHFTGKETKAQKEKGCLLKSTRNEVSGSSSRVTAGPTIPGPELCSYQPQSLVGSRTI